MRLIFLSFLIISSIGLSQQRIGFDLNYRQTSLNASISYHKVFAQNWLISGAVNFGGKGKYSVDYRDFSNTSVFTSPWDEVNRPVVDNNAEYELRRYDVSNRIIAAKIGLGYFHSFDIKHGIRGHIYGQYGQTFNEIRGYYSGSNEGVVINKKSTIHSVVALSAELYHTIHLWKKFTLYYGLKTPYYFTIDKSQFDPKRSVDNFNGLEPELTLGVTYLIGDC